MNAKTFTDRIQFLHDEMVHVGTENDNKNIVQIDDRAHSIVLLYFTPETTAFGYFERDMLNCDDVREIIKTMDLTKPVLVAPYHDSFNVGEIFTTYTRVDHKCIDLSCMTKSLRPFHEMIEDLVQLRDRAKERQTELETIIIDNPQAPLTEAQTQQHQYLMNIYLDTNSLIETLEHYLGNEQLHG